MAEELENIEKLLKNRAEENEKRKEEKGKEIRSNKKAEDETSQAYLSKLTMLERINYQLEEQIKTFSETIDTLNS